MWREYTLSALPKLVIFLHAPLLRHIYFMSPVEFTVMGRLLINAPSKREFVIAIDSILPSIMDNFSAVSM